MDVTRNWIVSLVLACMTTAALGVAAEPVAAQSLDDEVAALRATLSGLEARISLLEQAAAPCSEVATVRALLAEAEKRLAALAATSTADEKTAASEPKPAAAPTGPEGGIVPEEQRPTVDFYGSLRIRPAVSFNGEAEVSSKVSRLGWSGAAPIGRGFSALGRLEFGVNVVNQNPRLIVGGDPGFAYGEGDQPVNTRVGQVGFDTPQGSIIWGKQWSVYSDVSGWTDNCLTFGGDALGTYAAGTDGGIAGTGRAEKSLQYRHSLGPLHFGLQFQNRSRTENDLNWGDTWGAAVSVDIGPSIAVGVAYNEVRDGVPEPEPNEPKEGDTAAVAAVRYQRGPLYLAAGAADLDSHEVDEQGRYFDGRGFELFGQLDVTRRWFLYAAANDLRPDGSEVGEYRVRYGVLGLGYRLRGAMAPGPPASSGGIEVGAECKVENSTASDGSSLADSVLSFFINYGW